MPPRWRVKQSKLLSDVTNSVHYARLTTSRNVAQHWETWHTLLINVNKHRKQQNLILVCEQSAYRRLLVPVFPFCCNVPKLASYLGTRYSTIFECWKAVKSRISWLPVTSKKSQPACHTVMAFTSFRLSRTLKQNCVSKEDIPLIVAATVFLINNWSNWRPVSSKKTSELGRFCHRSYVSPGMTLITVNSTFFRVLTLVIALYRGLSVQDRKLLLSNDEVRKWCDLTPSDRTEFSLRTKITDSFT